MISLGTDITSNAPPVPSRSDKTSRKDRAADRSFADQLDGSDSAPADTVRKPAQFTKANRYEREPTGSIRRQTDRKNTEPRRAVEKSNDKPIEQQTDQRVQQSPAQFTRAVPPTHNDGRSYERKNDVEESSADNGVDHVPDLGRNRGEPSVGGSVGDSKSLSQVGVVSTSSHASRKPGEKGVEGAGDETLASIDVLMAEQGQVRKKAMVDFMSSMKKEFGVEPDKIVDAFSQMDETTLMSPPEESTKKFLSNLELPAMQQTRAGELYKQMVKTTGEAALNEKLIGLESGVSLDVVSPREQSLRRLNQAIDQLDNDFAMRFAADPNSAPGDTDMQKFRAQLAAENMNSQVARMAQTVQAQSGEQFGELKTDKDSDDVIPMAASPFAALINSAESDTSASLAAASGASAPLGATGAAAGMAMMPPTAGQGLEAQGLTSQAAAGAAGSSGKFSSVQGSSASGFAMGAAATQTKIGGKKANSEGKVQMPGSLDSATKPNIGGETPGIESQSQAPVKAAATGPAAMMMERPVPTAKEEQENIRELIHQAQAALKKGGGEIKMDLKPEGMGQVHLKVSVEDGQVNVQMFTESDAAKHLLEKGLHELKSNLAAHQLKLEGLKVDVSPAAQKHMDMDKQGDDQARQQTRQFANDVMGQFRDERQAFQQGFMENSGWRQYGRPMNRAKMQPETQVAAAKASTAKRIRPDGSNGLDLVA
jgi:flagellar hook-length control protein FliK